LLRQIVYVQVESLFSLEIPLLLINSFILNTILFDATDTYNNLNKKILSIKNINFETLGTLERLFHLDGYQIENVEAQTETIPINAEQYVAIVILGGPMAAYDNKIANLTKEQELIRNAIKNEIPVLGICLGSQLIAQAIGGRVFRGPKKEIGWFEVTLTPGARENLFKGITDKTLRVFQWHGDTYELPSSAKIMASSNLYPQAFEFGSAVGIQFHLEVNNQMIERWLREYSEEIKREHIKPEDILLPEKTKYITDLYNACKVVHSNFSKQIDFQRKK
jgi:GMP synthase (glutamine-hydrolysing)